MSVDLRKRVDLRKYVVEHGWDGGNALDRFIERGPKHECFEFASQWTEFAVNEAASLGDCPVIIDGRSVYQSHTGVPGVQYMTIREV